MRCAACGSEKDVQAFAGFIPLCRYCRTPAMTRECCRCGKALGATGFYTLRGQVFCVECADVMYRLLRETTREDVGQVDDVEVMAWIMIGQSMLGGDE